MDIVQEAKEAAACLSEVYGHGTLEEGREDHSEIDLLCRLAEEIERLRKRNESWCHKLFPRKLTGQSAAATAIVRCWCVC